MISEDGREFVEGFEKLIQRIERLEKTVRLFVAPVLPYAYALRKEPFERYLSDKCSVPGLSSYDQEWERGPYSDHFTHRKTQLMVNISTDGLPTTSEEKLIDALLVIATAEGRMPARVLANIQPDAFPSAVDAVASVVDDFE